MFTTIDQGDYKVVILDGKSGLNPDDDNVDIEVVFQNGRTYSGTFFTLANIHTLFQRWKVTGECAYGIYFCESPIVIVEGLTQDIIIRTVADLIETRKIERVLASHSEPDLL